MGFNMLIKLDKIWEYCLKMWDDIFDLPGSVIDNKAVWMKENGFEDIYNDCFFCHFADGEFAKPNSFGYMCDYCPGSLVDPKFDCANRQYYYLERPKEFRRKIKQLNKQRIK